MINIEKEHVLDLLRLGRRIDGRGLTDFREVFVETDFTATAEGSSRVKIGDSEVIVGIKFSLETPYPDTPNQGNLMVNAEFLPLSSSRFEAGPPQIDAIELARVVDRGIRESKMIDTASLCIIPGEKTWGVSIDICTINTDGNLIDASALAAVIALKNARFPSFDGTSVDYSKKTDKKLELSKLPICVTVVKAGGKFLVDLCEEEENAVEARLNIWTTENGEICALQKGGTSPVTVDDINAMIDLAVEKAGELRKFVE